MAEQITHKRPIRIKVDKEKRKRLQDFYKLNESRNVEEEDNASQADASQSDQERSVELRPPTIAESTLTELVEAHNTLLGREREMNNTIKNAIYENYYDLIKVNELLKSVGSDEGGQLKQLREILKLLE